jgi:hypothetical protein
MHSDWPFMHVACICTEVIVRTTEGLAKLQLENELSMVSVQIPSCTHDTSVYLFNMTLSDNEI